jgi:NitT/TauT family transport system permease protein
VSKAERRFRSIIGTPLSPGTRFLLGAVGVMLALAVYYWYAHNQHEAGKERFGPYFGELWDAFKEVTSENKRTETVWFWQDTKSSLWILAKGLGYGCLVSVVLGVAMGVFSTVHALFSPLVTAISKVPPLALSGVFLIIFGVEDKMKVALVIAGTAPTLANGIVLCAKAVPKNIIVKAYSLGASTPEVVVKAVLPMIIPNIIEMIRLSVGPAWVYVIASEYIVASEGIGYRIALSARMIRMDIIIVYCIWLAILGTLIDYGFALLSRLVAPWAQHRKDD